MAKTQPKRPQVKDLVGLKINQVGFVDIGAADRPMVALVKRAKTEETMPKDTKTPTKKTAAPAPAPAPAPAAAPAAEKKGDALAALEEWAASQPDDVQAMVAAAIEEVMAEEVPEGEADPSATPAPTAAAKRRDAVIAKIHPTLAAEMAELRKRDEERAAELAKLRKSDRQRVALAKVATMPDVPNAGTPEAFADALAEIEDRCEPATSKWLAGVLKSAHEAAKRERMLDQDGTDSRDGGPAAERLRKMATERAEKKSIPFAKAYREVVRENADLVAEASPRPGKRA